jgi:hypothetical protein
MQSLDHFSFEHSARGPGGVGFPFITADQAPRQHGNHASGLPLPVDLISNVLDHLKDDQATLRSLALCNKAFHSLAQPRLYNDVKLYTYAELLRFAYALALQPKGSTFPPLVRRLGLPWSSPEPEYDSKNDYQPGSNRLNLMILEMCPSVTDLTLRWSCEDMLQRDVDALDGFVRLTTHLQTLALNIHDLRPGDSSFGAEGLALASAQKPKVTFPKGTMERLRQLHSFELWEDSSFIGAAWPVLSHALGPSLRRIDLNVEALFEDELLRIAKFCPRLEEVVLHAMCRASYADVWHFIEMVGSSLTQFELNYIAPDEPVAGSASLVFESLMLYGKGIEVLRFITASGINKDDLQVLANPRCMPHLKELTLDGCECTVEMNEAHPGKESGKEENDEAHPCEMVIEAVLESHETTLKSISLNDEVFRLGDALNGARL